MIYLVIGMIIIVTAHIIRNKYQEKKKLTHIENRNRNNLHGGPEYQSRTGKWTPSGWVYDEDTQTWQPPDYLSEESRIKWRWDDEKRIWIDQEKEARLARYREYRKGKPPTFEEWKAMREQEEKNEQHPGE